MRNSGRTTACCAATLAVVLLMSVGTAFALDMSGVPFLSEKGKEAVGKDYHAWGRKCGLYTVAVSKKGTWGAYCWSKLTQDENSRIALEKCEQFSGETCGLVVVAGRVVPFQESPPVIRYVKEFDSSAVPFVSTKVRGRLKREYEGKAGHGALAITRNGGYGYATGSSSKEKARKQALDRCEKGDRKKKRCFVYAVGSTVVFDSSTDIAPER